MLCPLIAFNSSTRIEGVLNAAGLGLVCRRVCGLSEPKEIIEREASVAEASPEGASAMQSYDSSSARKVSSLRVIFWFFSVTEIDLEYLVSVGNDADNVVPSLLGCSVRLC